MLVCWLCAHGDQVLVAVGLCWLSYRWVIESLIVYQRRDRRHRHRWMHVLAHDRLTVSRPGQVGELRIGVVAL
jgi:hypothetical protein